MRGTFYANSPFYLLKPAGFPANLIKSNCVTLYPTAFGYARISRMSMQTPAAQKMIFRGRLEFGSQRTFEKVLQHWKSRTENYFKSDILFRPEELFDAEHHVLDLPQQVLMSTEKHWLNTTALLREIAQYALAGNVEAWKVLNGKVLDEHLIEPNTEKTAVSEYLRGRQLLEQGIMTEASQALTNAIEKFGKNALAYERRGYMNYKLKNFNDAHYDFSKSIDLNPRSPEPHYGRGRVRMLRNEWESALSDMDMSIKHSLAVQSLHWISRFRRGECLYHLKRFDLAAVEFRFFLQRKMEESDPLFQYRAKAEFMMKSV